MSDDRDPWSEDEAPEPITPDQDAELFRALDAYQAAVEAGQPVHPEQFLTAHPELADELRACMRVMGLANRMAQKFPSESPSGGRSQSLSRFLQSLRLLSDAGLTPAASPTGELTPDLTAVMRSYLELAESTESARTSDFELSASAAPSVAGRYRLLDEVGRGGMGRVFRAHDDLLGRELAVKVILGTQTADPTRVRRFLEEAQIGSQLQHPGIVPVYDCGQLGDHRPFFAMKLVAGRTLAELIKARADQGQLVGAFLQVCQTMAYAHQRGVIHRDLKPANVIVGDFGEVLIMDWGLAKVLSSEPSSDGGDGPKQESPRFKTVRSEPDSDASRPGTILGTPAYMPPEQARGETDRLDQRADVFGLGAILCEILTGKPPYQGASPTEIRRRAAAADLDEALQRLDACGADAELVALAKACLAADQADRPRDATAVAAAVLAYRDGVQERLRAAEMARVEAETKAAEERKRRRVEVGLAAALLGLAVLIGGSSAYEIHRRAVQQNATYRAVGTVLDKVAGLRSRAEAEPAGGLATWNAALAQMAVADDLLRQGRPDAALRARVAQVRTGLEQGRAEADRRARDAAAENRLVAALEAVRGDLSVHWDWNRADREYAAAFRAFGLDPDAMKASDFGTALKGRPATIEIAAALDHWCAIRIRRLKVGQDDSSCRKLIEAAQTADPDPWRNSLRALSGRPGAEVIEKLKALVADTQSLERQPAVSLGLLAQGLARAGDRDRVASVLRAGWSRFPGDFWVSFDLAQSSWVETQSRYERPEEALRFLSAALSARPSSSAAHDNLGIVLHNQGKLDEAIAEYRTAIRLKPDDTDAHNNLGNELTNQGKLDEAIAEYRTAIRLKPDFAEPHTGLGGALQELGRSSSG
jgi:serine/threonine-protein kinase